MAKKVREARRPTGRGIAKEINALMDGRISSGLGKIKVSSTKSLEKGIKQVFKALDIPTKKDLKKISTKVASMDRKLNKLTGRKSTRVATGEPGRKKVKRICKVKGCNLPYRSKGYCEKHYQAWRRRKLAKSQKSGVKSCKIRGCKNKLHARGYCWKHYMQWRRRSLK